MRIEPRETAIEKFAAKNGKGFTKADEN